MSHLGPGSQGQTPYAGSDMYNQQYNQNSDTELINLAHEAHPVRSRTRPFDWLVCSVLGYLCFPFTGICAMYYAIRANHAVDWERDPELIRDHTKKAKCLSLTSITLGTLITLIIAITIIVLVVQATNIVHDYETNAMANDLGSQMQQFGQNLGHDLQNMAKSTPDPFEHWGNQKY